jgi:transcription antitermination factor NusG
VSCNSYLKDPTTAQATIVGHPVDELSWFAVHTRVRHEKRVVTRLSMIGVTTFLPLVYEVHRWSDRRKRVQLPLFSCYVFVRIPKIPEFQSKVLHAAGVLRLVGGHGEGVPIPDSQIETLRTLSEKSAHCAPCPFLSIGQRVRVSGGSLDGIEGILTAHNGHRSLVISVEPLQRAISVCIDDYKVEAIYEKIGLSSVLTSNPTSLSAL